MRVIAGKYGGRRLKSLKGDNTRPTSDKLKETIFNIIGPYFKGGKVLDLYAGSGGLGIEAVSRGMEHAVLVDQNRAAINIISENVKVTKEPFNFEVMNVTAESALHTLATRQEKFTLIFLDPPYAKQTIQQDIETMIQNNLLADVSLIVCEAASDVNLPDEILGITVWDERKFGKKKIVIYQKIGDTNEGD